MFPKKSYDGYEKPNSRHILEMLNCFVYKILAFFYKCGCRVKYSTTILGWEEIARGSTSKNQYEWSVKGWIVNIHSLNDFSV